MHPRVINLVSKLLRWAVDGFDAVSNLRGEEDVGDDPLEPVVLDDHKILRLLQREGRVRQARIAEEFGWSASKTSRLLSRMEDDGLIARRFMGREKLVYFPHYSPRPPRPSNTGPDEQD